MCKELEGSVTGDWVDWFEVRSSAGLIMSFVRDFCVFLHHKWLEKVLL